MSAIASFGDAGVVTFTPKDGATLVTVDVCSASLADGAHGFHVHESGSTIDGCASMGGHYNPHGHSHGGPSAEVRHAGDLGNVASVGGCIAHSQVVDLRVQDLVGRGVVLHGLPDDLGRGVGPDRAESLRTGNAGPRVLCAPIVWVSPAP